MVTPRQAQLLKDLRGGGILRSELGGWRATSAGRLIRVETQEYLENTGELQELTFDGKYLQWSIIVHKSRADTITRQQRGDKLVRCRNIGPTQ